MANSLAGIRPEQDHLHLEPHSNLTSASHRPHIGVVAGHGSSLYHLRGDNPDKSGAEVVRSDRRMSKWSQSI
jgi:hypothetical protein